jgi:hypothetical protein
MGYPQVAMPGGDCGSNVHLNDGEIRFSNELIELINQTIKNAAARAGVQYVNIEHALDGHRLCEAEGDTPAMNGLTIGDDLRVPLLNISTGPLGTASYHPNALGHQLIAHAIREQTDNLTRPDPVQDKGAVAPEITDSMALLANVERSGRPIQQVQTVQNLTDGTLVKDNETAITVDGLTADTLPNSTFAAELHSTPVSLGSFTSDGNGDINGTVTIPGNVQPGFHTIHLYGKSYGGDNIDLQQVVYVAQTSDDYDGDGILNVDDPCVILPASGLDVDKDGVDDACDGAIGPAPAEDTSATEGTSAQTTGTNQVDQRMLQPSATISVVSARRSILGGEGFSAYDFPDGSTSSQQPSVLGEVTKLPAKRGLAVLSNTEFPKDSMQPFILISAAVILVGMLLTIKLRRKLP